MSNSWNTSDTRDSLERQLLTRCVTAELHRRGLTVPPPDRRAELATILERIARRAGLPAPAVPTTAAGLAAWRRVVVAFSERLKKGDR
jgi:hypothetical protein